MVTENLFSCRYCRNLTGFYNRTGYCLARKTRKSFFSVCKHFIFNNNLQDFLEYQQMINISRGRQSEAVKGLVYGISGIGKTTFASKWPDAVFIDVEGSTKQLPDSLQIARVEPDPVTYPEVLAILDRIKEDPEGIGTLVIDSADWLEGMMIQSICKEAGVSCIEKYEKGYGKGWIKVCETWSQLLDKLDFLRRKYSINILFVAHSKIKRFEPADDVGYDRYTLVQNEKSADILKKWTDLILFAKHEILVVENEDKVNKARSNGKRVMYTEYSPCWDAKNRFGLKEKLPFDFEQIRCIFNKTSAQESCVPKSEKEKLAVIENDEIYLERKKALAEIQKNAVKQPSFESNQEPAAITPKTEQPPVKPVEKTENQALAEVERLLQISGIGYGELAAEVERNGLYPAGTPIRNYNEKTLRRIIAGFETIKQHILTGRK